MEATFVMSLQATFVMSLHALCSRVFISAMWSSWRKEIGRRFQVLFERNVFAMALNYAQVKTCFFFFLVQNIMGFDIPVGDQICVSPTTNQRLAKTWPDADVWKPDRYVNRVCAAVN